MTDANPMNRILYREIAIAFIRNSFSRLYSIFPEFRRYTRIELRTLIGR